MWQPRRLMLPPELLRLGPGAAIDERVILGYPAPRALKDEHLSIGAAALIRSGSVIYSGTTIGDNLKTGHNVVIREENSIGDNFCIWSNSVIDYGCRIGRDVKVHSNCYIAQFTEIEDEVFLAPGVTLANDIHPGCPHSKECMRGPKLCRGAQLGVNVTVLPFVTIGERAVIGAGTVVTKDVPPGAVVVGNPGRVVKRIEELTCLTGLTGKPYTR